MNEMPGLEKQKSQSGQALVEYVLLLAIGTTLLLGLASQFYKPFGNWVQNQMGPYLECLLDVGELPSLGNGAGDGECATQFQPFSAGANANGNPPRPLSSNGGGNDGGGNPQNSALNSNGSGSGGGTSNSAVNSSRGRNRGFPIGGGQGADGAGRGKGDEVIVEKLPESRFLKLRSGGGGSVVVQQRIPAVGIAGSIAQERAKQQSRETAPVKVGAFDESEIQSKGKKLLIKPTERKTASEEEDRPWTFGEYFKFAIILMIIVAIVLFLAGQVAQISKSMEK